MNEIIELRSDTFTRPSLAMLDAMMSAPVGDDVFGEDPTVNELEAYGAGLFGMEAAIFCPSGTMTNQIAIKAHTQPGDEVICDELSHVYQYEAGGIAFHSGCSVRLLKGNAGRLTATQVQGSVNNTNDIHKAVSRLVCLENTANRGGGACYDFAEIKSIAEVCQNHNLALHLDGARLFNALVAKNENPLDYGLVFDSISICLSKGLGAPVGSLLLGKKDFILKARRLRKLFGGGMRQAGYLAAAGLYAIKNNVSSLTADHYHARITGQALSEKSWIGDILPVETNILIFGVKEPMSAALIVDKLAEKGVRCLTISSTQIRMVFHLDVTPAQVDHLIKIIRALD